MSFSKIQSVDDKQYKAENIENDDFKVFFTSCEDMSEIPDDSVHLHFTSPPYFLMRGTVPYESYVEYLKTMYRIFTEMYRTLKPGRVMGINISDYQVSEELDKEIVRDTDIEMGKRYDIPSHFSYLLYKLNNEEAKLHELKYEDTITWVKPGSTSQRAGTFVDSGFPLKYRPNQLTERILVFRKGEMDYRRVWKDAQRSGMYDDLDISTFEKFQDEFSVEPESYREFMTDFWEINPETQSDHPAPFPVELPKKMIELYSLPRETVCDPFLGFATTLRAAQETDRKGVGYENFEADETDGEKFREKITNRISANSASLADFQ